MTELVPEGIDEEALVSSIEEESLYFAPHDHEKEKKFKKVLKTILPYLGTNEVRIVIAEVIIILKLEGILGKKLTKKDTEILRTLKDSIMSEPIRKEQALRYARKLLQ